MKREFLQNLKVGEEALPKEVIDAIMDENGRDIQAAKDAAVKPYADYQTIKDENKHLKDQQSDGMVDGKTAQQWKGSVSSLVDLLEIWRYSHSSEVVTLIYAMADKPLESKNRHRRAAAGRRRV